MKKFKTYTLQEQLEAVKNDGYDIQYIHNPSEEVCLEAVKRNGYAVQYIQNPSEEVCLEAVKNDGLAIRYVPQYFESVAQITDDIEYKALKPKQDTNNSLETIEVNGVMYKRV